MYTNRIQYNVPSTIIYNVNIQPAMQCCGNVCGGGVNDKIMHANLCLLLAVIFWQYKLRV